MQFVWPLRHTVFGVIAAAVLLPQAAGGERLLDVPYVPTPQAVVDRMLELAKVKPGEYLIDLGSGDGRIAVTAARTYGARALGVDLNPARVQQARANALSAHVENRVSFQVQDLFQTDISRANVLTMYLLQRVNDRLRPRILEQLRPGTRVVSHAFDLGEWEPDRRERVEGRSIYFWIVPARINGRWQVADGGRSFMLEVNQQFQKFGGSAEIDGRSVPLRNGRVNGVDVSFELDGRTFHGRVNGNAIEGMRGATANDNWRASRRAG